MPSYPTGLSRRSLLALGLAAVLTLPAVARAAPLTITDALGRTVALKGPAERIVLGFNFEEFTAVAGPAGWDRGVGFARTLWTDWRPATFKRYQVPIPRLTDLPDAATQYLAKQLYPEQFADIDPVEELRRFHEQFLPVTFEGTWMARLTPRSA